MFLEGEPVDLNKKKRSPIVTFFIWLLIFVLFSGAIGFYSVYTYKHERLEQKQMLTERGYELKDVELKLVDRLTHNAYTFLVFETPEGYADSVVSSVVPKNLQYDYTIGQSYTVSVYVDDTGHCEIPY